MSSPSHPSRLRQRGAKAPLSREAVVRAALDCLHEGGPAGLTMRKVAARLETGPASLYVYVRDLRELQVLVLDSIASKVPRTSARASGEARVVELLLDYASRLWAFRGAARLALLTPPTGPAFLDLLETAMASLVSMGLSVPEAARVGDALFLLTTATIAEQDARRADGAGRSIPDLYDAALADVSAGHPLLAAGHKALRSEEGEPRLEWSIRTFLSGVPRSEVDHGR